MGRYDDLLADITQPKKSGAYDDILAEIDKPEPSLKDRIYKAANDLFRPHSVMEGMDGTPVTAAPSAGSQEAFDNVMAEQRASTQPSITASNFEVSSNPLVVGLRRGLSSLLQQRAGAMKAVADATGNQELSAEADAASMRAKGLSNDVMLRDEIADMSRVTNKPTIQPAKVAAGTVSSIVNTAPSLVMGELAIPAIFASSGLGAYQEGRDAGLNPAGAALRAIPYGASEAGTEMLGGSAEIAKSISKGSLAALGRAMADSAKKEVPSEMLNTASEFLLDKAPGIGLNQDAGVGDLAEQLKDTALQTLLQSGGMAAGGHVINQTSDMMHRVPVQSKPAAQQPQPQVDVESVLNALNKAKAFAEQQLQQDVQPAPIPAQVAEQPNVIQLPVTTPAAVDQRSAGTQPDNGAGSAGAELLVQPANADIPAAPDARSNGNPSASVDGQSNTTLKPLEQRVHDKRDILQAWMPDLDWQEVGGRVIRQPEYEGDPNPPVVGRTSWVPKDWNFDSIRKEVGQSYPAMRKAVQKALDGEKLNAKEQATVTALMDFHDEMSAQSHPVDPADTWTQASQEEQDALNHALQDEAWLELIGQNASTDELSAEIARFYEQEQNDSLKAERAYDDTHGQAESVTGENPATAPPAVRAAPDIAPAENSAVQEQPGASSQAAPVVSQTGASTPVVSQNPQPVQANERAGVRPHIEALIKRRAAANQMGKSRVFDNALDAAKSLLAGEDVKPAKFKNAAATLKDDKAMHDALMALHDIAKTPIDRQSSTEAPAVSPQKTEAPLLTSPTPQELEARDNAKEQQRQEEAAQQRKQEADAQRADFTLAGSNREADQAAARGAQDLFAQPAQKVSQEKPNDTLQQESTIQTKIEDFGEKIAGAKKDLWQTYQKALSDELPADAKDITLSKHFPEPDYETLLANGVDIKAIALVKAMRDEIPSKPQKSYKLKRWAEQLRLLRDFSNAIINGLHDAGFIMRTLRNNSNLNDIADRAELYAELGYGSYQVAAYEVMPDGERRQFNRIKSAEFVTHQQAKVYADGVFHRVVDESQGGAA